MNTNEIKSVISTLKELKNELDSYYLEDEQIEKYLNVLDRIGERDDDVISSDVALSYIHASDNLEWITYYVNDLKNPTAKYVRIDGNGWLQDITIDWMESSIDDWLVYLNKGGANND